MRGIWEPLSPPSCELTSRQPFGKFRESVLAAYLSSLPSPTCLMVFRLHPRADQMYLYLESKVVFGLLEMLLGGTGSAVPVASRNLTEIEWSLLEEVVRVVVRPLAEAWNFFAPVEFEVDSLISEPSLVPVPQPAQPMIRMAFDLVIGAGIGCCRNDSARQFPGRRGHGTGEFVSPSARAGTGSRVADPEIAGCHSRSGGPPRRADRGVSRSLETPVRPGSQLRLSSGSAASMCP